MKGASGLLLIVQEHRRLNANKKGASGLMLIVQDLCWLNMKGASGLLLIVKDHRCLNMNVKPTSTLSVSRETCTQPPACQVARLQPNASKTSHGFNVQLLSPYMIQPSPVVIEFKSNPRVL